MLVGYVDDILLAISCADCELFVKVPEEILRDKQPLGARNLPAFYVRVAQGDAKDESVRMFRPADRSYFHYLDKLRSYILICRAEGAARRGEGVLRTVPRSRRKYSLASKYDMSGYL